MNINSIAGSFFYEIDDEQRLVWVSSIRWSSHMWYEGARYESARLWRSDFLHIDTCEVGDDEYTIVVESSLMSELDSIESEYSSIIEKLTLADPTLAPFTSQEVWDAFVSQCVPVNALVLYNRNAKAQADTHENWQKIDVIVCVGNDAIRSAILSGYGRATPAPRSEPALFIKNSEKRKFVQMAYGDKAFFYDSDYHMWEVWRTEVSWIFTCEAIHFSSSTTLI